MASPFTQPGSVAISDIYGPVTQTRAEQGTIVQMPNMRKLTPPTMQGSAGNILTIPVILAMGALVWYAIHTYG